MPFARYASAPVTGILYVLPVVLSAQTDWAPILAENYSWLAADAVLLLVRDADLQTALTLDDELILKLRAESQLIITPLPSRLAEDLWAARGWGRKSHWILVNARGEEGSSGMEPPSGRSILDFLRSKGVRPRWEVRNDFLKEHPAHGEAWGEAVQKGFALARNRLRVLQAKGLVNRAEHLNDSLGFDRQTYTFTSPVTEIREQQADQVFEEWAQALEGLRGVEGWLDLSDGPQGFLLKAYGAATSPRIRNVCKLMLRDLEAHARQEPDGPVSYEWSALSDLAGNPPGQLPSEIVPLPGRLWPSLPFMFMGTKSYLADSDWDGVLAFLSAAAPVAAPGPANAETQEEARVTLAVWALAKVMPLFQLGKEGEALAALEDARHLSGPQWPGLLEDGLAFPFPMDDPRLSERARSALKAPPLPAPPAAPTLPGLRLALLGKPAWKEAWARLRLARELLPWSPGELTWATIDDSQGDSLRARQAWGPEPRWALLRGGEILATGLDCPTPGALAGFLSAQGPSALQRLDAILERQPEHNAARRARIELLKARMPDPRLEPLLVEDERAVWHGPYARPLPLDFGPEAPWKPDSALWQWAATQTLPRIQDRLEQWPGSDSLWVDWVTWSRFHPAKPSPVALAKTLPIWGSRSRWALHLSLEVHKAVAQALKARGDFRGMVDWFSLVWEVHPKTPGRDVTQVNWDEYKKTFLKKFEESVVKPFEEALVSLGRSEEAREVERTFRAMSTR